MSSIVKRHKRLSLIELSAILGNLVLLGGVALIMVSV